MDNNKKNIDQIFKEGLHNRSFGIPESFEKDLTQRLNGLEKKKRGFFLWLLMLFCIVDFSIIALLLINNHLPIYTMSNRTEGPMDSFPISIDSTNTQTHKEIQIDDLKGSKKLAQVNPAKTNLETPFLKESKQNELIPDSNRAELKKKASTLGTDKKSKVYTAPLNKDDVAFNQDERSTKQEKRNLPESKRNTENKLNKTRKKETNPKISRGTPEKNIAHLDSLEDKSFTISQKNDPSVAAYKKGRKINSEEQKETAHTEQSEPSTSQVEKNHGIQNNPSNNDKEEEQSTSVGLESNKNDEATTLMDKTEKGEAASKNAAPSRSESKLTEPKSKAEDKEKVVDLNSSVENKEISTENETTGLHQGNKNLSNWRTEIQLYGGFGSTIINDDASESYLGLVNKDRKPLNTPTFGLNGNVSYKNITFGLGLSYLQTGETYSAKMNKINFTDISYLQYDSIVETISYYEPYGVFIGDSIQITLDSSAQIKTVSDTATVLRRLKNRYSWISVPVYFGYHFSFGKYELTPRIGAQFNFGITPNSGQYPNSDFETLSTFNAAKFNMSYLVNIELKRNFNNWSLFVRPYFKSMINPAIDESILKRKYSSWGIQVGVGFDL